jgi:hypothetical protein
MGRPAQDPAKVIRIEMIEVPVEYEKGEGEYEVRRGDDPKDIVYHDLFSLEKWLRTIWPQRADDILNRLQNFRIAYLNLQTGEITT